MKVRLAILCMCSGLNVTVQGQSDSYAAVFADSVLHFEEYLDLVYQYHPVAIVANLEVELAENDLRRARGGFDPQLYGNYDTKTFKNIGYYDALNAGVVVPTWMGLSFQGGLLQSSGSFLNPEKATPGDGLLNVGVTAQLGAGLLMDNRRAALRQAQIGLEQGQIDRQILLNSLYYEATSAYFNWAFAEAALGVAMEALDLANFRYDAVRQNYRFGDVPAIDTVEAYTQVLNRMYRLREVQTRWVEAVNMVGVYLWDDEYQPRQIPPGVRPQALTNQPIMVENLALEISPQHPELRRLSNTRDIIDIDRRLAAEYLRPRIELKYNFLSENVIRSNESELFQDSRFFVDNYDFAARVHFPLFLREARGRVGMNRIYMQMVEQDYYNQQAVLKARLDAALVDLSNLREQIGFFELNVSYLDRLLDGERQLFNNGESSLFLINARETQLVDGQNIFFELLARERILYANIRVIAGQGF